MNPVTTTQWCERSAPIFHHLAVLKLKQEKIGEAERLLTAILRDTPDSQLAPSAAYLAAETASLLARRDVEANHRVGHAVAKLLPSTPGPMVMLGFTLVATLGQLFLAHREKLRKEGPLTVIGILLVVVLTGYTTFQNQQKQHRDVQAITEAAAQQALP